MASTGITSKEWRGHVLKWAKRLGLSDWSITTHLEEDLESQDGPLYGIETDDWRHKIATVKGNSSVLTKDNTDSIACHEVLHIFAHKHFSAIIHNMPHLLGKKWGSVAHLYGDAEEAFIDDLAALLTKHDGWR